MAGPYYVDSTATGGSDTGGSWANAFLTFAQAVTAATTANDIIYVSHAHSESLGADTTYTFGANVRVLCVNSGTGALATTAAIGVQSTNYSIFLTGGAAVRSIYVYGVVFKTGTSTTAKIIDCNAGDGNAFFYEQCTFHHPTTTASSYTRFGIVGAYNSFIYLKSCTFTFAHANQYISYRSGVVRLDDCTVSGTAPTILFNGFYGIGDFLATGCDFSAVTGTLCGNDTTATQILRFSNCKLGASVTVLAAASTNTNNTGNQVYIYNCNSGDNHYAMAHYSSLGETTVSATIYANDGASYDGTNKCSWKIVTTANCSYYAPYVSPWMDVYHSGTSEISPYLEILRSGSTTKYQNDEVWSEWSYQGTSGSTKATIVSDRMTPLGTAADQTASSLDASGWTGEDATNNAFMKLEAGAITPAEIGHIRARVCVGEPSITVYVDPKIRGLS